MTLADRPDTGRELVGQDRLHSGRVFDFVRDEVRLSDGDPDPVVREYIDHPGAVAIVALRGEPGAEEVALLSQYRHPVRAVLWEIPAGLRDHEGEKPALTAARELREETDFEADRWDVLVDIVNSPGCTSEGLRIYLAREISQCAMTFARAEEERDMELRWVDLDEAVAAVHAGRVHNSTACVGLLAAASARASGWATLREVDAPWDITGRRDGT